MLCTGLRRTFSVTQVDGQDLNLGTQRFPRPLQTPNVRASQILRPEVVKALSGMALGILLSNNGREGLYCSSLHNSFSFCHFTRKICILCRLRPSHSSLSRLSKCPPVLLWTTKALKKVT